MSRISGFLSFFEGHSRKGRAPRQRLSLWPCARRAGWTQSVLPLPFIQRRKLASFAPPSCHPVQHGRRALSALLDPPWPSLGLCRPRAVRCFRPLGRGPVHLPRSPYSLPSALALSRSSSRWTPRGRRTRYPLPGTRCVCAALAPVTHTVSRLRRDAVLCAARGG